MYIFSWIMLVFFSVWFFVGVWGVYSIITMTELEKTIDRLHGYTGEVDPVKAIIAVPVPFVGAAACIGYIFG